MFTWKYIIDKVNKTPTELKKIFVNHVWHVTMILRTLKTQNIKNKNNGQNICIDISPNIYKYLIIT